MWSGRRIASTIAVGGLLVELGWFALDPKGDARQRLIDLGVRALNAARL